jgi:sugar lactone lactonase YvrE
MPSGPRPHLLAVDPPLACPGGVVSVSGAGLLDSRGDPPIVTVGDDHARILAASNTRVSFRVPDAAEGGHRPVQLSTIAGDAVRLHVAQSLATGIHQVDGPVFDDRGRLYVTVSGARGQQAPVSVFRVGASGAREPFASGIVNATSMAIGPDGLLYVTSRFEGIVYKVSEGGEATPFVTEVGVACGLAFGRDGALFVGDRSGTVFRIEPGGQATVLATLPPSIAAYHLAVGPDGAIHVSVPTLASCDRIYRVSTDGHVDVLYAGFGRPQGLAFDAAGSLHVVEALAGASGVYRLEGAGQPPLLVASGEGLVGITFDPTGALVVASNDTVYGFVNTAAAPSTAH